jgi:hypothetical protein
MVPTENPVSARTAQVEMDFDGIPITPTLQHVGRWITQNKPMRSINSFITPTVPYTAEVNAGIAEPGVQKAMQVCGL